MYIGVDIGGTTVKIGVVSKRYRLVETREIKTDKSLSSREFAERIIGVINELKKIYEVTALGVGIAGDVHYREGFVGATANLPFNNDPVAEWFEEGTGLKTYIDNDANCAALGEFLRGKSKELNNIIVMTLGTGIGGGIIINRKIYHGQNGRGGEIGHICINSKGKPCACGGNGCLEHYASAKALIKETKKAVEAHPDSILAKYAADGINGKTVFDAAYDGKCPVARRVLDKYITYLKVGIYSLYNIFEPDAIILAGGVSGAGDRLLSPLKKKLGEYVPVNISTLQGDAGMIGAALLHKYMI